MTQQINLLDRALLPVRDWCNGKLVLGLGAALALGTAGHFAYEQQALKQVLAGQAAVPDPSTGSDPLDASLAELRGRVGANERLLRAVGSFSELPQDNAARLRALIGAMPESLWLQEVEFSVERGVRIAGGATGAQTLAGFSARLGALPTFRGLPLHVFALQPQEREADTRTDAVPAATAAARAAEPRHYAFVLSSIDAERSAGKLP